MEHLPLMAISYLIFPTIKWSLEGNGETAFRPLINAISVGLNYRLINRVIEMTLPTTI